MNMKALVKTVPGPGLSLMELPTPPIRANEVLIKISKTGICGTDLHIYKWNRWAQKNIKPPLLVGHEFVGEVVELGKEVTHFSVGDRVTGEGHLFCKTCRRCLAGQYQFCLFMKCV